MTAGRPALVVTATISGTGVLTVWGLDPSPRVLDEGAPGPARNALVNLLRDHARATDRAVCAAARTPAGPWHFAVDTTGATSSVDPDLFTAATPPDLDPQDALAGTAAVFAAAADSPPAAMLALATDPDPAIRAEALGELATWPDDPTPVADAELPAERLERLACCHLAWVRVGVAANPGTNHTTLVALVTDPDPLVLAALAARFDLAPDLIVQLAADPDPRVHAELRRNPAAGFLTAARPARVPVAVAAGPATPVSAAHPAEPGTTEDREPGAPGPAAPHPSRGRSRVVAGVTAGVLVLGGGGYAAVTARTPGPGPAAAASTPGAVVMWNGMALPAGPDGPADPAGDVAAGFARTPLGAAAAAAHLSVRIDPLAGPGSFRPTITGHTYGGDPAALLAATTARYAQLGGTGGPIPTSTGQITGWAVDAWAPDGPVTVHLRVVGPDGTATDFGITVVWVNGDYRLLDPTRADTFTTSPAADPATYRSFR